MKTFKQFINEATKKNDYIKGMEVYHGTARDFDDFDDAAERHPTTPKDEAQGHFFTNDASTAYTYAQRMKKHTGAKPRLIRARLQMDNPKDVTSAIKKHIKAGLVYGDAKKKAYSEVDRNKHDGAYHRGDGLNTPEYVAFSKKHVEIQR
jgi:hypothetical protein